MSEKGKHTCIETFDNVRNFTRAPVISRSEQEIRTAIAHEALRHQHKPYAPQGWGPTQFDCLGLIAYVGQQASVLNFTEGCEEGKKFRAYPQTSNAELLKEALSTFMVRLDDKWDAGIGDVFWFKAPQPQHLGIIVKDNPLYYVIHASENVRSNLRRNGEVVLQRLGGRDGCYVVAAWRYPKLQEVINEQC